MTNTLLQTRKFFELAVKSPTIDNQNVQLGCHVEEFREMLDELEIPMFSEELILLRYFSKKIADALKTEKQIEVIIKDKVGFLDAMTDQIVTAIGVTYMHGMDGIGATDEVNSSNLSKFVDGLPVFNSNGKIIKGKNYYKPNLIRFVGYDPLKTN